MAEPFDTDPSGSFSAGAARARDDLNQRFRDLRREAAANAQVDENDHGDAMGSATAAGSAFRRGAEQAADEARGAAASLAGQARARLDEIVGQQKAAGADKIAGMASAARSAAGDLEKSNPGMARLVRTAAENVDRIADDVRERDLGDVIATLTDFGRRQPVAFFGGAVLAGFLVARLFKSDVPVVGGSAFSADRPA